MAMNKKLKQRIFSLHRDGCDRKTVIRLLITMAKNTEDSVEAIDEFLESEIIRENKVVITRYQGGANQ
ncbi:MAG: hypothetical protein KKD77_21010 [Gammaproteobacteria bacterium]|nr:hypothetical protein [Gammaproteobacteria bacterium]